MQHTAKGGRERRRLVVISFYELRQADKTIVLRQWRPGFRNEALDIMRKEFKNIYKGGCPWKNDNNFELYLSGTEVRVLRLEGKLSRFWRLLR